MTDKQKRFIELYSFEKKTYPEIEEVMNIKISMDGKGRATDNICIERFRKTIKYEEIYLNEYKKIN